MALSLSAFLSGLSANVGAAQLVFADEVFDIVPLFDQLTANGAAAVELSPLLQLPKNAVVAPGFTVTVRAGRAEWTTASSAGQVRRQGSQVVIDFGALQTVAGVALLDASQVQISAVKPWTGTAFANRALGLNPLPVEGSGEAQVFDSQIRTERLEITLTGAVDVGDGLLVQLPDLPADFSLRINGGAPVWSAPGPAVANSRGWAAVADTSLVAQEIDLAPALNALLADPAAAADPLVDLDLHVVLSARVPGVLQIAPPANLQSFLRYLAPVALPPGAETLRFAAEGRQEVALPFPSWAATIESLRLTVAAKLPPERAVPPEGPDAAPLAPGSAVPLAEMRLDPQRSVAVALPLAAPGAAQLAELVALRLPLTAEAGGAEVRALLLAAAPSGDGPGEPLPGAVSQPALLDGAGGSGETWVTLPFPRPVPLAPGARPWLALAVTRGAARWALGPAAAPGAAGPLYFGPPDGPWQPFPGLADLAALAGRLHLVGHAAPDRPFPALRLALAGAPEALEVPVTPAPKGVPAAVSCGPGLAVPPVPRLAVVSHTAGTVTLTQLVATVTRRPA